MLFIYSALKLGGIETFFVRMTKERYRLGLSTSILLLSRPEESNDELLIEVKKHANVMFSKDIFLFSSTVSRHFSLIAPINQKALRRLFLNVEQIHVFDGMHALFGHRLANISEKKLPVTIGFYHYIKYLWGGENVAWYERCNRKFIFNYLPEQALLFFSEGLRDLYRNHKNMAFEKSNTFRLGVIDEKAVNLTGTLSLPLKIVTVGRLVDFKTYNFFMLDVVSKLLKIGIEVEFDIYGDGPLKNEIQIKIERYALNNSVTLKGPLDYSNFDSTLNDYDLFIGSGSAIIQAASLGLPSIVGIENMLSAKTYGYFCSVHNLNYHRKGLELPLLNISDLIYEYVNMNNEQRLSLKKLHCASTASFTNENCQRLIDKLNCIKMPQYEFKYNKLLYTLSRLFDQLNMKYNKKHPRRTQFEDFRKLDEY